MKRLTVTGFSGHIAYKQDHRGGVLKRGVHANGGIGGPRPAGHKTDAGPSGELAMRLSHEGRTTFLAVDDKLDLVRMGVKTVQHRQIAFTGHAKSVRCALGNQAFHQQMAGDFWGLGRLRKSHARIVPRVGSTTRFTNCAYSGNSIFSGLA